MSHRNSQLVLLGVLLLTGLMGYWVLQLQFNYEFENLFPDEDEEVAYFQTFRNRYQNENDYLAIGIRSRESVFRPAFLHAVDSLARELRRLPHVLSVSSLTDERFLRISPIGLRNDIPLIHLEDPAQYPADSTFLFSLPVFVNNVISRDSRSLCLYLRIGKDIGYTAIGDTLLTQIYGTLDRFGFEEVYFSGGFYANKAFTEKLREEMWRFLLLSLSLIIVFLYLSFRFVAGVWIPVLLVLLSSCFTLGLMAALGVEINLMTVLIPPILFVVATSDAIHLLTKYLEELRKGHDRADAIRIAVREVGLATLLTSLTTAFGFLMLWPAGILPFRQFGLFTAVGVLIAFGLTIVLLPALLTLLPVPVIRGRGHDGQLESRSLHRLFRHVLRYRKAILLSFALVVLLAAGGVSRLSVQNYFADEINPHTPLGEEIQFFETEFGGLRPFALGLTLGDSASSVFEPTVMRELDKIENYLATTYGLNRRYSLVNNLKAAYCSLHNGNPRFYRLPRSERSLARMIAQVKLYGESYGLYDLMTRDERHTRITGTLYDLGSTEVARRNRLFEDFLAREIDANLLQAKLTGAASLIDRSNQLISFNMMQGLLCAILVVSLLMGLLYRSFRMVMISLIPNLIPLILVAGYMGWAGIGLKMSTAIIFTLAFGIAVDDTIHFISRLRIELQKGRSIPYAVKRTFLSTGKAILITSVILASGFFVLVTSDFQGTMLTGLLIGLALLMAVLADLLLLPLLLLLLLDWRP